MILSKSLLNYHTRQLRQSPATGIFLTVGWMSGTLLTFILGQLISTNRAELTSLFTYLPWILAVLIPTLTMPIASETRRGVAERLLTLPHTPVQRLFSRFAVLYALLGLWILGFWPLIATLYYLGSPDFGPIATGLLGSWLLAAPMLAISIVLCLCARSGVGGLLASLAACLMLLLLGTTTVTSWFSAVPGFGWLPSISHLTLLGAYQPFTQGLLNLSAIFLLMGLSILILGLSLRRTGLVTACIGAAVTLLAIIPALNWMQLDTTAEGLHTPSPITVKALTDLPSPVTFTLHLSQNNPDVPASVHQYARALTNTLLRLRASAPSRVVVKVSNADTSIASAISALQAGATEQSLPTGTTYFAALTAQVGTDPSTSTAIIPILQPARQPVMEYDIMTLVSRAVRSSKPTIAVLNSDAAPQPEWERSLSQNFAVTHITPSLGVTEIDSTTSVVVIPTDAPMPAQTLQAIRNYLGQGGNVLLAADAFTRTPRPVATGADQRLSTILPEFGITLVSDSIIADPTQATLANQAGAGATAYPYWLQLNAGNLDGRLPFTSGITKLFVPESGSLTLSSSTPFTLSPLVTSSPNARAVSLTTFENTPAELASTNLPEEAGSHVLAAMASGAFSPESTATGNLLVFGDSDWLTDTAIGQAPDNLVLFTNILHFLSGQSVLTQLRAKGASPHTLTRIESMADRLTRETTSTESKIATRLYEVNQTLANNPDDLAKAQEEEFTLRQQLRTIRQQTRHHLQGLENALLLLNLALMPTVTGALFFFQRRRQRLKATSTL